MGDANQKLPVLSSSAQNEVKETQRRNKGLKGDLHLPLAGKPAFTKAVSFMGNDDVQIPLLLRCAQDSVFFAFHILNRTYRPVDP
jgi:hypothetical protein